jgi:hypothetical protein
MVRARSLRYGLVEGPWHDVMADLGFASSGGLRKHNFRRNEGRQ